MAVSPWYIALSASLMGHTVTLTLLLGSWTLLLVARERRKFIFALAAGLLAGLIFITRPLDGLILGGLTGLWTLGFLTDRSRWPLVVGFGLGCIVTGALLFPYNAYLTGDPLLMPLQNYLDELWHPGANRFGFGPDIGPDIRWGSLDLYRGHGLVEAVANSQHSAYSMNVELFGWGVGSLALVFVHCLWGRWTRLDRYMLVILVLSIAVAGLYWFNGSYYIGPRYWFMAFLPLVVLTAGGLRTMVSLLQATGTVARPAQRVGVVVAVLCVIAMTSFVSWRGVTKYHEHRGYHADYRDLIEQHNLRDALIFVKGEGDAELGSAFAFTTPDPRRPGPVFARDLGPERNKAVSDSLPDRQIYFVTGRVQRTDRIRIVEGPVTREMLNW
jgi:4-amino-4-deoxy-L-arabinose transferase-like glycosyltransferase